MPDVLGRPETLRKPPSISLKARGGDVAETLLSAAPRLFSGRLGFWRQRRSRQGPSPALLNPLGRKPLGAPRRVSGPEGTPQTESLRHDDCCEFTLARFLRVCPEIPAPSRWRRGPEF